MTGALISTGQSFAQILEGLDAAVEEIKSSISADRRHTDIQIVFRVTSDQRRFQSWGLVLI